MFWGTKSRFYVDNDWYEIVTSVSGIKINELDALYLRGFTRSRIASRAIEAYLIQVINMKYLNWFM